MKQRKSYLWSYIGLDDMKIPKPIQTLYTDPSLFETSPSISSKNIITGAAARALRKSSRSNRSELPTHFDKSLST